MNEPEFALAIARLSAAVDKKPTKQRLDIYFERLKDIPFEAFTRGIDRYVDESESNTFPSIGRLRAACDMAQSATRFARKALPTPEGEQTYFCRKCEDTGFEPFMKWAPIYEREVSYVRRCECWLENPKLVDERLTRQRFKRESVRPAFERS
jgi:hypothetical protein